MNNTATIGVDLGGTDIKAALVSPQGEILFHSVTPTPATQGAQAVVEALRVIIETCLYQAVDMNLKVHAAGIGTPGIVSPDGCTVLGAAENITGWENINVASPLEFATALKVRLTNDANAMALGEWKYGAARGHNDVLFVTVGTGIGGAALINGKPWRGYQGRGMEIGHIAIDCNGEKCACGSNGCLEHLASTAALVRYYEKITRRIADGKLIVEAYKKGEPEAQEAMQRHWNYLGAGIASLINVFAPQLVVVGGGITQAGEFYMKNLREAVMQRVIADCAANTAIVAATLGNNAGALGASTIV